jgi:uncharacterized membrane protein
VARALDATERLEAFSDGVFAVAITLLVLDLSVGHPAPGQLGEALVRKWPHYATYVVSFLTIGIIWANHHQQFSRIARADRTLMLLNLLLLLFVTLIPFPTGLLAQYLRTSSDQEVAAVAYSGALLAMGVAFYATYYWANRAGLFADWVDEKVVHYYRRRNVRGLGIYVLAIGAAFVSAPVSLALCGLNAIYFALPGRPPSA